MEGLQTVDLHEDESGNLVETLPGGRERTWFPHLEYLWVACESIQIQQTLKNRVAGSTEPPQLVVQLAGRATLTNDELGLIGDSSVSTKTVSLQIRVDDRAAPPARRGNEPVLLHHVAPSGRATLTFNRAGWEAFASDDWLLECSVSSVIFEGIVETIAERQLRSMTIAVSGGGLWSDKPMLELGGGTKSRLFLRPRATDNSLSAPESLRGDLMALNLRLEEAQLSKEKQTDLDPLVAKAEPMKPPSMPMDRAEPTFQLGPHIESLRNTIKWVGGLIAAALIILAIRH